MNKRDYSRKAEAVVRLPLAKLLQGQTFLILQSEKRDVHQIPVEAFDRWVDSLCEEITGVNREVWDVFARWRFINFLLAEGVLLLQQQDDGTVLLVETEEKSSELASEPEEKSSADVAQEAV